ncbi:hypothetical protein [Chryseobacterium gleum]|uniref:hypothetical protein n=1 Tax=Chryseobacterium gleum TaxID=250 RepID=UPI001E36A0CD|nr:hypothetical protein [Chryseobacterium gleum]MCD9616076.1 hypothetical protein [Chryseobacterium gleum]
MKNNKISKEVKQLSFDFTEEKKSIRRACEPAGKIISIFSDTTSKINLQNKIFKDVINHSKSF